MPRSILTTVTDRTNEYLLRQNYHHGTRHHKVLSAAKIARALLAGCAAAEANLGVLATEEDIVAVVAGAFKRLSTERSQA